jgi:hypothetical protein
MYVKRHEHFRVTARNARIAFVYVFAIPSIALYYAYKTDVSFALIHRPVL